MGSTWRVPCLYVSVLYQANGRGKCILDGVCTLYVEKIYFCKRMHLSHCCTCMRSQLHTQSIFFSARKNGEGQKSQCQKSPQTERRTTAVARATDTQRLVLLSTFFFCVFVFRLLTFSSVRGNFFSAMQNKKKKKSCFMCATVSVLAETHIAVGVVAFSIYCLICFDARCMFQPCMLSILKVVFSSQKKKI